MLDELQARRLPGLVMRALNDSAFEVRTEWADVMPSVFDRPTALTLRAPLVRKATPQKLQAEVFIRDEAFKGTPPAQYLAPQVFGGDRRQKRSERWLERYAGFPRFWVPGRGLQLDQFGNVPRGTIVRILSQLQASPDASQRETATKRQARLRRQKRRGGGGSFFVVPQKRGKLRPGVVYERVSTGLGSAVRSVLFGVQSAPSYSPRYDVFGLARAMFARRFRINLRSRLAVALGS